MTLDQYLERFVEGYLFGDLRSMAKIKLTGSEEYGGVGYPMVMATFSGIELLGILTSEKTFGTWNGEKRFRDFWKDYLYMSVPEVQPIANSIYTLARNGIAHSYTTKPIFIVTKAHHGDHMRRCADGSFLIDALSFHEDLVAAYEQRVKPKLADDHFRKRMTQRYSEFRQAYKAEYETMKSLLPKLPKKTVRARVVGVIFAPTSPSAVPGYSTNMTTKPFKP